MRLGVRHHTTYRFDPPMRGVVQSLRLWPSQFDGQTVIDWSVGIDGATMGAGFTDGAGDRIATSTVLEPVEILTVAVSGTVETADHSGVLRGHRERIRPAAYLRTTVFTRPNVAIRDLAAGAAPGATGALDRAHRLTVAVAEAVAYTPGETHPGTTAAEALADGKGVCQDHAHLLIAAALTLDVPARYVTGYLHAAGDLAEASHAWAELYVEDLGWVGFDPSNGVSPDARYIRIGSGADALEAAPIRGVAQGNGAEALDVDLSVVEAAQ